MTRLLIAGLRANAGKWLSTCFAIATAVAFLVGTLVFSDTIDRNLTISSGARNAEVDAAVRSADSIDVGFAGSARSRIPASLADEVRSVPGVEHVAGTIQTPAEVVGSDGHTVGSGSSGATGAAWIDDPELSSWSITSGRSPAADGEIALDAATAAAAGYQIGAEVPVITQQGREDYSLVGVATLDGADGAKSGSTTFWAPTQAQAVVGAPGAFDSLVVGGSGSEDQLAAAIRAALDDPALEVITGSALRAESSDRLSDELGFVDLLLVAFAGIAVLVAALLIANTFSILVARRLRELALLRALGAGTWQLTGSVLAEALVLGAFSSVVGIAMGFGVALGLTGLFARFGFPVGGGLALSWTAAAAGLALGTGVTVVAAVLPARRAASMPPVAALREAALPTSSGPSTSRVIAGASLLAVAGIGLAAALFRPGEGAFWFVLVGGLATLVGAHALAPLIARRAAGFIGGRWGAWPAVVLVAGVSAWLTVGAVAAGRRPVAVVLVGLSSGALVVVIGRAALALSSPTGRIGRSNAMRNPSRTAATATTLMVGLAVVMAVSVLAASMQATVDELVDASSRADFILLLPAVGGGVGVSPELAAEVAQLPGVEAASGKRFGPARVDGHEAVLTAVDPQVLDVLFDLGDGGAATTLGPGQVGVARSVADRRGWSIGDDVVIEFAETGPQSVQIASIFDDGAVGAQSDYLVATSVFEANYPRDAQLDRQVLVKASPGADLAQVRSELDAAVAAYPQVVVNDQEAYRQGREAVVDRLVRLVYALLALSVLIAAIGIVNTLSLSVLERTREIGVLRAIGMTRRQLGDAVRWESIIVSLLGSIAGVVLGLGLGAALATSLRADGITSVAVPLGTAAAVLVLGITLGVGAAVLPARRAAALPVLVAVAEG